MYSWFRIASVCINIRFLSSRQGCRYESLSNPDPDPRSIKKRESDLGPCPCQHAGSKFRSGYEFLALTMVLILDGNA